MQTEKQNSKYFFFISVIYKLILNREIAKKMKLTIKNQQKKIRKQRDRSVGRIERVKREGNRRIGTNLARLQLKVI